MHNGPEMFGGHTASMFARISQPWLMLPHSCCVPPSFVPSRAPQVLAIRTSTLEEKATACNMIVCYLDELKEGFFPYVQEVGCLL